uniref:Centromere-associated protein E-like n=1 Tax=Phascolarctos cinereus TaxID=38626 RepID=A0A6P5LZZ4_PHACI|nr:centromere-associated protein E-like [Phascolarctos cinereus]
MADEGAVTVCVRVRPLISREQDLGDAAQLHWKTEERLISQTDGTRSFSFDRVFHSNETTEKVYEEMAVPIIRSAIQGYNGTIFAYGQTASGKTYTMMGSADGLGVIPKAINDIFIKIKEIPEREFLLRVSYMEIYNETITDLLCDSRKRKPLEIREDFNRNVYVADLTEEVVSTPELTLQWIKKGERNRKTKMSQRSTRSHTIFRMILESREKGDAFNSDGAVMVSHLDLVDLAGSERDSQTGSEGVWLEGCNNRSLCILGQVIQKLNLDTQEELEIAQMCQKEYRQTIDKLEEFISEKEASEKTIAILQKKIQELEAKREQTFSIRGEVNEVQEKMNEIEQLKELLKSKESTLERIEMENLELAQKLQASLEETTSVTEERDELAKTQEALHRERDQLKEAIRDLIAKDQETKEELKFAEMCLKEHEETIDMFEESILEKTDQVSKSQEALEKTNAELQEKIQELQEQKEQVFNSRKEVTEAQEKVNEVEHLKEQLKSRDSTLERIEMESLELAQKLQASLEETTSVTEERDELRKTQEALHRERDQLKETIRDLIAKDLEMQEKLKVAQMDLKEHRDTMDKLKECISEKEAIKKTSAELQEKIQKLEAKQEQIFNVREEDSEAKEKMKENELKASVEETTSVTEERDELTKTQEALHKERDQLKETIRDLVAKDQETQEELKFAEMCLKEHQETIHKLKECISEKTTQVSKSQEALEKTNAGLQEKILKLQETEEMLLSVGKEVNETKLQKQTLCQLVERLIQTLSAVETARLDLTQKLDSSLSKMNTIIEERDALKETEKALLMEVSHLKESLKKSGALDQQYLKKLINNVENPRTDFKQFHLENFKRKYLHIKRLLEKYIMLDYRSGFLTRLSFYFERTYYIHNRLQVNAHLYVFPEYFGKSLADAWSHNNSLHANITCFLKVFEEVLRCVIEMKRDHHNTIHKFEMNLIEEAERQNDFFIKIQHLQQHSEIKSQILSGYKKLCQKMDLHIVWAQVDERSLSIIQKENERIFQKQNLFLNKITFLVKESSEFAKRSVAVYNDWELELRQMKNKNEEMLKKFQTVKTTLLPLHDPGPLTVGENKKHLKTTKKVTFNLTNDPTKGEFQFHRGTDEWKKERSETSAE